MGKEILAFDLGGSLLRAAVFTEGTRPRGAVARGESRIVRESGDRIFALEEALRRLAAEAGDNGNAAVVLAVPGPVYNGTADRLPTLFGPEFQEGLDFAALGRRVWPEKPVVICNDLTAAGYRFVGDGFRDFLVVTIASGISSKLFINGRPLLGSSGHGGEIGHWRVPGAKPLPCDCGSVAHLGALASGRGCLRLAQNMASEAPAAFQISDAARLSGGDYSSLTTRILAKALHLGDAWTESVLAISAAALGSALALCHLVTGTERFFVTGGFAGGCGEALRKMIWQAAEAQTWPTGLNWDRAVVFANPEEEHGLIGAGVYGRLMLQDKDQCG